MYFITATATTFAVLSGLTSAAPLTSRAESPTFNLAYKWDGTAEVPEPLAALKTGTWYIGNKDNKAVLFPSRDQAGLFYEYGLASSIATADTGITIIPGGTATVPSGAPIQLAKNNATSDVSITKDALLWHQTNGRFQACALGNSDDIYLSYVEPGQRLLADCTPVTIEARCSAKGVGQEQVGKLGGPVGVNCRTEFIGATVSIALRLDRYSP
ncbi:hypothetical protein N0V90_002431 [Kalmusia sp. IMI 367209]|nr:hypothetical protein N0V90_002431 [Kalmusia sp. IMI 367209]